MAYPSFLTKFLPFLVEKYSKVGPFFALKGHSLKNPVYPGLSAPEPEPESRTPFDDKMVLTLRLLVTAYPEEGQHRALVAGRARLRHRSFPVRTDDRLALRVLSRRPQAGARPEVG